MATKITLTLPKNLSDRDQEDLRSVLKDAFHEFATKRYPAGGYVADRYVGVMSPPEAMLKVGQVERRSAMARALHDAAFGVDIMVQHVNHSACTAPCGPGCMRSEDE
jgi:hypothetical protein